LPKSKRERTKRLLSSTKKLKIKILRTAIGMSNSWKQRKKWKDSTKTRSSKCAQVMNMKWREEDKTTEKNKKMKKKR
jgi:hypothetical protein